MSPLIYQLGVGGAGDTLQLSASASGLASAAATPDAGLTILFQSQFDDLLIDGDNGEWLRVPNSGYNEPTFYQRFDSSLDADLPGAFGYRIIGDNGTNFSAAFTPAASVRPAAPAVGESITWRWHHKMIQSVDPNYHPFQFGNWGSQHLGSPTESVIIQYWGATADPFYFNFQFDDDGDITGTGNNYELPPGTVPKEWIRYEVIFTRLTTTTYKILPRVYNQAGTLLADPDDFTDDEGTDTLTDAEWTVADADWVGELMWGSNGLSNVVAETEQDRWAAFLCVEGAQIDLPYPQTGEN